MAIAVTHQATSGTGTDATSFSSASFTPAANVLLVACYTVDNDAPAQPVTPTLSGHGTWTAITTLYWRTAGGSVRRKLFVFALNTGESPGASAVTFDHGAETETGAEWSIYEVTGTDVVNTGVAAQFVQIVPSAADITTGTSLSITLADASNANNRPFALFVHAGAVENTGPRTNWTEIGDGGHPNPTTNLETQWRSNTFETTASASWTTDSSNAGLAFEIKALVPIFPPLLGRYPERNVLVRL